MILAYIAGAFVVGAAVMAYLRDQEDNRRHWEEWDRKREAEKRDRTPK